MKHTKNELAQMQSLPLNIKIQMTKRRIREWYEFWDGQVRVSFSGGKDSTVLLHMVRELYPDVEAVFVNTGLEYPEIQKFVKTFDNVTILRPEMRFDEVIKKYGYPIISKDVSQTIHYARQNSAWAWKKLNGIDARRDAPSEYRRQRYGKWKPLAETDFKCSNWCCLIMKERPFYEVEKVNKKKPIVGILAEESERRKDAWLKTGCNAFDSNKPVSKPMSFWTEQDVLQYIKDFKIPIASVYGDVVFTEEPDQMRIDFDDGIPCGKLCTTGCDRTGCMFCAFGAHLEKGETRFQRLKRTHPKQYAYCIGGGAYDEDGIWKPNKDGLGMGHVFDELNKIYGEDFIRYK